MDIKYFSDNMKSDRVPLKPPRMTQGGVQRIQKRPEISNTQHTSSYDDETDSNIKQQLSNIANIKNYYYNYLRLPWKSKHRYRRNRVVEKRGVCNIEYKQISKKRRRFITDAYTTLIDSTYVK